MRQKTPKAGVLLSCLLAGLEAKVAKHAVSTSSNDGVTGTMWRVMTRRNERNWFFQNTRREQGIGKLPRVLT